jgi:two-component system, NtrC family, sensor histidine kinase HydH
MGEGLLDDLKRYVGFDESDAAALARLSAPLSPALPAVVEVFYQAILQNAGAAKVISGGEAQLRRLRQTLLAWLRELFNGTYGESYFEQRCEIGRVHVRIELPQHYMFAAMNVVRLALVRAVEVLHLPDETKKIAALHKILDIELAIMNDTYREDLIKRIHEIQHAAYEQKLSESEHLATVGQLAASLAHEIKNPLAGISGAIQVLGTGLDDHHPHKEIIAEALRQIDRLDAAVKDLLIYARPKPPQRAQVDLNELLGRALILFRQEPAFRNLRIHCEGLNCEHFLDVDGAQMQQVFSNLLINAGHACEHGGEITCRIGAIEDRLRVVIEDTGVGIPADILPRVVEPFFTTKSRGTGLGLSICQRIVEAHRGTIELASEVGKGTRVTIEIPN